MTPPISWGLSSPESALAAAALVVAWILAVLRVPHAGWWERPLAILARRKRVAILAAALLPMILRAALLPRFPVPEPHMHDEFSFLLAADTLLHGRLANPQHPLWPHFESIHILSRPTYSSAFPIAPAIALAAGRLLLGHPWAGVWLSGGLMCGALCWMLQGWLPPRWALLGTLLAILRIAVSSYWMNTYWGGFVAAAGGALVLGAMGRMRGRPRPRHGLVMGLGLAILANSRPVEGAVLGVAVAGALLLWVPWKALWRVIPPMTLVLAITLAGMGYYFFRVTGKPLVAPYVLYRQGTVAPHFLWQRPGPVPLYDNADLRNFYVHWEMGNYAAARHLAADLPRKLAAYWRFYLGPLLTIPLFALWKDRRARLLLGMLAFFSLSLVGQVWHNPHYAAPATGLPILLAVLGMRRLRVWRPRRLAAGLYLVRLIPLAAVVMLAVQAGAVRAQEDLPSQAGWRWPSPGDVDRARILRLLESTPQQHLVLVRYSFFHDPGREWVYNRADIDHSHVVWARELDRGSNAELIRYFAGRSVWLVEPDAASVHLTPYADAPPRDMFFVPVGAPGIAVLRSPDDLRRLLFERADPREPRGCDVWNFIFSQTTGIGPADPDSGCYPGTDRRTPVTFDYWFAWLQRQR